MKTEDLKVGDFIECDDGNIVRVWIKGNGELIASCKENWFPFNTRRDDQFFGLQSEPHPYFAKAMKVWRPVSNRDFGLEKPTDNLLIWNRNDAKIKFLEKEKEELTSRLSAVNIELLELNT